MSTTLKLVVLFAGLRYNTDTDQQDRPDFTIGVIHNDWSEKYYSEHKDLLFKTDIQMPSAFDNVDWTLVEAKRLQGEINTLQAATHVKVCELEQRIQNLLAISHSTPTDVETRPVDVSTVADKHDLF